MNGHLCHWLEFKTIICSEELKDVKEQADPREIQSRLMAYGQIIGKHYQIANCINSTRQGGVDSGKSNPTDS